MIFLRSAAIAALTVFVSFGAAASEAPSNVPPLLERALQKGEAANQIRWAFTSSFEDNDARLLFRFEPRGDSGTFTLLEPQALSREGERIFGRLTDDDDADSDLTYEQARVVIGDQQVQIVEETDESVTYSVRPNPWDDLEPDQIAVMEHMTAQLTVSKSLEQVTRLRLYNHESFHAQVVARIDRFEQIMEFAPEPTTGLPLMTSLRQEVEGRAFFQRIHRVREEAYRDYLPVRLVASGEGGGDTACDTINCIQEFLATQ